MVGLLVARACGESRAMMRVKEQVQVQVQLVQGSCLLCVQGQGELLPTVSKRGERATMASRWWL